MKWVFLVLAITGEVFATAMLKASEGFTQFVPSIATVVGYGLSFYFLSLAITQIPLSIAYAIWAGLGIVLVSMIGVFIFKQSVDIPGIIGIALILIGVVVINLFSKMATH